ncbi:MAG: 3-deoxy-manno-octulosonate cytidylyltransferase [Terrimicrobiaceae bacterium]
MAAIIIPARWGSTRFPGKPLALLAGKPLVLHVWERCRRARLASRIIVATDDFRIAEVAFDAGAEVAMTKPSHPSGTDRVAEVASRLSRESIIVNVQGDEPFTEPSLIDRLIRTLQKHREIDMATAANPILEAEEFSNPNVVKVVRDREGRALYFSRAPIPNDRDHHGHSLALRHHGIYAYRRRFLLDFVSWKPTPLESSEKLEQLRALEHGRRIHVLIAKHSPPGIDTPEQALAAENHLAKSRRPSALPALTRRRPASK